MGRDGLVKQWIKPLLRIRKLALSRKLQKTLVGSLPSIFGKPATVRNSHENQKEQERMEIKPCSGQVNTVPLGRREQIEIRENLMTRIFLNKMFLCLSSFLPSAAPSALVSTHTFI